MPKIHPASTGGFHSHHSPFGAFASFTIGLFNQRGGFGHALRGPADQNIYVGYRESGDHLWRLLPFFVAPGSFEGNFTGELSSQPPNANFAAIAAHKVLRTLGWCTDTWRTEDGRFEFGLATPFDHLPDPASATDEEAKFAFSPHINGWIEFDNRSGVSPVELVFGVGDSDRIFRPLEDSDESLAGFAVGTEFAYATARSARAEARQGFDIFEPKFRDHRGLLLIGGETGLILRVPAGERLRFPLALAFFENGTATTGMATDYAYTRWFRNIESVLAHGLEHRERYLDVALMRDQELEASGLNTHQQFLVAQGTHSYLGNSQLLWGEDGPVYVVNEGEYRMMNTFDLAVDQMFFELQWFPWAVRNILDLFASRYSYVDQVKHHFNGSISGGISFTHDMGVMNNFTPSGYSSYECVDLTGCFSQMTMEQLLNWVLMAVTYSVHSKDREWLKQHGQILLDCAESIRRRDHPDPANRDGIMKLDSSRCGESGAEITTYDSLDVSLGQARNNLYLAVKTLGAWILLEHAFNRLGETSAAARAQDTADQLARTLATKFSHEEGSFPAVFENGNRSRIIPAVEGFVYPLFLGIDEATDRNGRFAEIHACLARHLQTILKKGICIDESSGGWKVSSTSTNTWFSKIALAQHVIRTIYPDTLSPDANDADAVHAGWQQAPGCGEFAMCDQIRSDTGYTCGSRYYPRGVTSVIWMNEPNSKHP